MKPATTRSILRWFHIILGIPVIGYVYTPFEELHGFAHLIRFGFLPALVLSGLWLWQGPAVRRLIWKGSVRPLGAKDI